MSSSITAATANKRALYRKLQKYSAKRNARPLRPSDSFLIDTGAVAIPTTSIDDVNDETILVEFPDSAYGIKLEVTASDMDTNVSPTLAFNVNFVTSAGVSTTLIAATTIGQAGGTAAPAATAAFLGLNLGAGTLRVKVTAVSATPAAGTIRVIAELHTDLLTGW